MRVIFAGTPEAACWSLRAIVAAGIEVAAVITRPDAPAGRGRKLRPSPVALLAEELGSPVWKPERCDAELVARVRELQVDAAAVVAFGMLLTQPLINIVPGGWINLHFSLLPRWRGAAPVQRAILAGDTVTGATTFSIVSALDAGPVYRSLQVEIDDQTSSGDLLDQLAQIGAPLLVGTLRDVASGLTPVPQAEEGITLAAKLRPDDVRIDWSAPRTDIVRLVRAANPAPMAWTMLEGQRFQVLRVAPDSLRQAEPLAAGQLTADRKHLWVGTGDGDMELLEVKAAGRKPMKAADWARGRHEFAEAGLYFDV